VQPRDVGDPRHDGVPTGAEFDWHRIGFGRRRARRQMLVDHFAVEPNANAVVGAYQQNGTARRRRIEAYQDAIRNMLRRIRHLLQIDKAA
jgi:hypothetical protein